MKKQNPLLFVVVLLISCLLLLSAVSVSGAESFSGLTRNLNSVLYADRSDWGITFTVNKDNSVTVTGGPPTGDAYLFSSNWSVYNRYELPAGVYTLSGGISRSAYVYITFFNDQTSMDFSHSPVYDYGGGTSFSTDRTYYCIVQIFIAKDEEIDGTTFYPQVETGRTPTAYASPWEGAYQAGLLADIRNEIRNLQGMVDAKTSLPQHLIVPDYYHENDYLDKKCDRINALARSCASLSDTFAFITDMHWTLNAGNSPALLKYIREHTRVDKLFCGGDVCDFVTSEQQPFDAFTQFCDAWQAPIYTAMGNHEYLSDYGTEGRLYYTFNSVGMNRIGNLKRNYFYVDNPQSMIRYIVLNAFAEGAGTWSYGYEAEQMAWLAETALDLSPGWGAVVVTHMTHEIENGIMSKAGAAYGMLSILDQYAGGGEIIAVLSGHTHADYLDYTQGGIPILITACDKYRPWTEKGVNQEPWLGDRIPGTVTEQAIDTYIIDRAAKTITRVRIGAKIRYGTDSRTWTEYDDVTVSYARQ